jgi:hypothetical protein
MFCELGQTFLNPFLRSANADRRFSTAFSFATIGRTPQTVDQFDRGCSGFDGCRGFPWNKAVEPCFRNPIPNWKTKGGTSMIVAFIKHFEILDCPTQKVNFE